MQRILIFSNGDLPDLDKARTLLRPDDFVICADGGTRHALDLGVKPDLAIGDMDSVENEIFQKLRELGVEIDLFPRDKNETDLELAINKAVDLNPPEIVIIAALGGRIDQTLANIALLANPQFANINIKLDDGLEEIYFGRDQVRVDGRSGDILSLIPWGGPVNGVWTENLKWKLDKETLYPDKTRGISNVMLSGVAHVRIDSGLLLIIHTRNS